MQLTCAQLDKTQNQAVKWSRFVLKLTSSEVENSDILISTDLADNLFPLPFTDIFCETQNQSSVLTQGSDSPRWFLIWV